MEDRKARIKKIKTPLFVLFCMMPFILAFIGYFFYGEENVTYYRFWNSVYASLELYALNPVYDMDSSNGLVYSGAICGILVDATVILTLVFGTVFRALHHSKVKFSGLSTAIYSDNDLGKKLADQISNHGYLVTDMKKWKLEKTHNHIVICNEDVNALNFLVRHKNELVNRKMYLVLNQVDSALLDKSDINIHYLNKYELLARDYWGETKNSLYDYRNEPVVKVAILGYGPVGKAIFKYGYMNNIYNLNQSIQYHIWGAKEEEAEFLNGLLLTDTKDTIEVHTNNSSECMGLIAGMDRVIITDDQPELTLVQGLLWENTDAQIHVYNPENVDIQALYFTHEEGQLATFGNISDILTWDNIINEELDRNGKLVCFDYTVTFPPKGRETEYSRDNLEKHFDVLLEENWKDSNGYSRGSSLARADHLWIEKNLRNDMSKEDILVDETYFWRMEHARWCRFMYMNHWSYGPLRDNARRIHNLLRPFDELGIDDQGKNKFNNPYIRKELGFAPIKNIIFDIGRVLMFWDPKKSMEMANEKCAGELKYGLFSETDMERVMSTIFTDPEVWQQEDISIMNHDEMVKFLRGRAGEDTHLADMCEQYYEHAVDSARDFDYACRWVKELKKHFNVYYLSNFGEYAQKKVEARGEFKFIREMDGGIFSYEIHKIKPGKEIYSELFKRYNLKPQECIFIDDNKDNVLAAKKLGMWGIEFTDQESANNEIKTKTFY